MNQPKPTVFNYNDYLELKAENADLKQRLAESRRREQAADGEWVEIPLDVTDDRWGMNKYNLRIKCTNCGFVTSRDLAGYAFCPVCGADMRGLQEAGKGSSDGAE